jgi:hypothetical protein
MRTLNELLEKYETVYVSIDETLRPKFAEECLLSGIDFANARIEQPEEGEPCVGRGRCPASRPRGNRHLNAKSVGPRMAIRAKDRSILYAGFATQIGFNAIRGTDLLPKGEFISHGNFSIYISYLKFTRGDEDFYCYVNKEHRLLDMPEDERTEFIKQSR